MRQTWVARPTTYKGIRMRSRLEARMAAELDNAGNDWEYEPRAFADQGGQYLPDFRIFKKGHPVVVYMEVKPTFETAYAVMARMQIIWSSEPTAVLMIWIDDGDGTWFVYQATPPDPCWRLR